MPPERWKQLAAQEAIYGSEFGTVQGGAWERVSTQRAPGEMPLPPQVQAEALRREREEAQAKAVAARAAKERAEQERRVQEEAARREAARQAALAAQATRNAQRVCATCGTTVAAGTGESAFLFCLGCGNSFAAQTVPPVVVPPPPVLAHGGLRQQARREMPLPGRGAAVYAVPVRMGSATDILPTTEATPYVAAILSFLLPGAGQVRNAQFGKGLLILLAMFALLTLLPVGLWSVTALILRGLVALDAYRIGERRRRGQSVSPWQWDAGLFAER